MGMPIERGLALTMLAIYSNIPSERRNALSHASATFLKAGAWHHHARCAAFSADLRKQSVAAGASLFSKERAPSTAAKLPRARSTSNARALQRRLATVAVRPPGLDLAIMEPARDGGRDTALDEDSGLTQRTDSPHSPHSPPRPASSRVTWDTRGASMEPTANAPPGGQSTAIDAAQVEVEVEVEAPPAPAEG